MARAKFNSWANFRAGDKAKIISLAKHPDEGGRNWLKQEDKKIYYGKVVTVERVYRHDGLTWADFTELYFSHPVCKFKKVRTSKK